MIVYVESNFVLEIALEQEDAAAALAILSEAERNSLTLAIPEFSVTEPISTITIRGRNRQRLSSTLSEQVRELSRSMPHQASVAQLRDIPELLREMEAIEIDLLEQLIQRLIAVRACLRRE